MARRRKVQEWPRLSSTWPLFFWKSCENCGHEFRREKGWKLKLTKVGYSYYLCNQCAPISEDVHIIATKLLRR